MKAVQDRLEQPVRNFVSKDFIQLPAAATAGAATALIRELSPGHGTLFYFYVVDENERLVGVLQTRSLLAAQPDEVLSDLMVKQVIAIPETALLMDACELFVLHKLLAFPVVDRARKIVGVVDVHLFNEEVFGISHEGRHDELFQAIGFRIEQVRTASPLMAVRFRLSWLLVTIGAGTACALLARAHEATLSRTLVVAFFLTLVLALGESVAVQSMALVLEELQLKGSKARAYFALLARELITALPLALIIGTMVFGIVWLMGREVWPACVISGSLGLAIVSACLIGQCVPFLMHAAGLDLKIAAGPITLAVTDVATLTIYLTLTAILL
jgi:magnesium transporter